jgi:hypothetical protein
MQYSGKRRPPSPHKVPMAACSNNMAADCTPEVAGVELQLHVVSSAWRKQRGLLSAPLITLISFQPTIYALNRQTQLKVNATCESRRSHFWQFRTDPGVTKSRIWIWSKIVRIRNTV